MQSIALRQCSCLFLICNLCLGEGGLPVASQRASAKAILEFLHAGEPTDGVLTGQNLGHSNGDIDEGYRRYFAPLKYRVGRTPAIMSADYGYDKIARSFGPTHYRLTRHAQDGGIVSLSMHPPNPWRNSDVHDTNIGELTDLLDPGTKAYRQWRRDLDHVAKGLAELRDDGVVVLWRPFHEMNGGWFWWCPERNGAFPAREEFIALWRDMFDYFSHTKRLDNLLWVFSAAVQTDRNAPSAIHYYPGDAYVDVTGLDWYMTRARELDQYRSYSQLVALNKPFGLTEFGPGEKRNGDFDSRLLIDACSRYPKIRFYIFWHSWPGSRVAMVDVKSGPSLLMHPQAITRSMLPDFVQGTLSRSVK